MIIGIILKGQPKSYDKEIYYLRTRNPYEYEVEFILYRVDYECFKEEDATYLALQGMKIRGYIYG